jgi:hypothetical protein
MLPLLVIFMCHQSLIQLCVLASHALDREVGFHAAPGALAHPDSLLGMIEQPQDGGRQGSSVSGWGQQSGLAVPDRVHSPADLSAHHRPARGHRLQRGQRQSLKGGWQDSNGEQGQPSPGFPLPAHKPDVLMDAEPARLPLQC